MNPISLPLIGLIRGYRIVIAPILAPSCRFAPSCSAYSIEALERHGPIIGTYLTIRRILRCHPWGGSGYDPVPDASKPASSCHRHSHS